MRRISTFTGVKNRYRTLRANIGSWLNCPEISEFIIVDWSSSDMGPAEHDYLSSLDPRIQMIRVTNKANYHIAAALNTAAARTTGNWLLRLDVDYVINPYYNFFAAYQPTDQQFVTGDWTQKYVDNECGFFEYINGLLYVSKDAFQSVGGYDERLTDYGWEDDNLYIRLIDAGYERMIVDAAKSLIYHTPHGHNVRMANFQEKNRQASWQRNWEISGRPEIIMEQVITPPKAIVGTDGTACAPTPPPIPRSKIVPPPEPPGSVTARMPGKFVPKNI